MIQRAAIVAAARDWIGTRWQHQAMLKGVATDCIGLVAGVAAEVGIPEAGQWAADPRRRAYGRDPDVRVLLAATSDYLDEIPIDGAGIGDVLLMRVPRGVAPQHFAIISERDPIYIVHAYAQSRRVVENRLDGIAAARVTHAFRFRGVE